MTTTATSVSAVPATAKPGPVHERLAARLQAGLAPLRLEVEDLSHRHRAHGPRMAALAGKGGGGGTAPLGLSETHFRVTVVSAAFEGLSRVARHRRVNELLAEELARHVHALEIRALTPTEAAD
ncbi:BolA family protein [Roseospirillum parvum]|uniref:BolA protein n=1 Tax=Roseospirillum parvum TaxID=83401 RepID=A0A1G7WG52_9PROT|nr:BolA family protein [Roseospirillum parvum]SDG70953.1 BolA protein [Roseospirillum parvum]